MKTGTPPAQKVRLLQASQLRSGEGDAGEIPSLRRNTRLREILWFPTWSTPELVLAFKSVLLYPDARVTHVKEKLRVIRLWHPYSLMPMTCSRCVLAPYQAFGWGWGASHSSFCLLYRCADGFSCFHVATSRYESSIPWCALVFLDVR